MRAMLLALIALPMVLTARTLEVGPGQTFSRIEEANEVAEPGDVIRVHPLPDNAAYQQVAVLVRKPNLTFQAVEGEGRVRLSGEGFDYSGVGSTPRAIFQFHADADGGVLEGFELFGAHNRSHNGAGVRINQANGIVVRHCHIHGNDMGIMSNGDGSLESAVNQLIEHCVVHHNGAHEDPGYNHNFYLGGTSVTLRFCHIHHSLTGHNVKSRAHQTRVLYCYVHHSANREFDLVDGRDTERPGSHAVLMGNVIVKDPEGRGNRGVIHFGQDGGKEHDGTLFLVHNTVVTPFVTPLVMLSTPKARAHLVGNLVTDGGMRQSGQQVAAGTKGGEAVRVTGSHNAFGRGFPGPGETGLSERDNHFGEDLADLFVNPETHDYRLTRSLPSGPLRAEIPLPSSPGETGLTPAPVTMEYAHPAQGKTRDAGATAVVGAHEPM